MDFQTAVKTCFSKYADFNGRASRSEYWWFVLAEVIVLIVASLIHQFVYVIAALGFLDIVPGIAWFALKVLIFLYVYLWFRASWPRYRYDQLMKVGWQVLMPLAIANLIVTAILVLVFGGAK